MSVMDLMKRWTRRNRETDFVRDTKDGYRLNIYWACGGYWMIKAGHIDKAGDWEFFVGRQGRRMKGSTRGPVKLETAVRWAGDFADLHDGWVGETTYEFGG